MTAALRAEPFRLQLQTNFGDDHLILQGEYLAAEKSDSPTLILVHGLGSTREEWEPLIQEARKRGWGTLAYDLRGHGTSRTTRRGAIVGHQDPRYGRNPAFWKGAVDDLRQILVYLKTHKKIPPEQIVLIGASLGANVCVNAGVDFPIRAAVLLSPGERYAYVDTPNAVREFRRPLLMIVNPDDYTSFLSVRRLRPLAAPKIARVWVQEEPKGAHGAQMFDGNLEKRLLHWLEDLNELESAATR
jgi:pimeloyl-ACP methyl ester carboxylesterase